MSRVYELPTHLEVEDKLIAGLSTRQLLRLLIGASLAYGVWDQLPWVAQEIRLAIALVAATIGVVFALLKPHGRTLDSWLMAALLFVALPRQLVWRPGVTQQHAAQPDRADWGELELQPEWLDGALTATGEDSTERSPFNLRFIGGRR
jgi:hypothetical protein